MCFIYNPETGDIARKDPHILRPFRWEGCGVPQEGVWFPEGTGSHATTNEVNWMLRNDSGKGEVRETHLRARDPRRPAPLPGEQSGGRGRPQEEPRGSSFPGVGGSVLVPVCVII